MQNNVLSLHYVLQRVEKVLVEEERTEHCVMVLQVVDAFNLERVAVESDGCMMYTYLRLFSFKLQNFAKHAINSYYTRKGIKLENKLVQ